MKYRIITIVGLLFFMGSCTKDFDELNIDPVRPATVPVSYLFARAQIQISGNDFVTWRSNFIYPATMIQHMSSTAGYWTGDKYTFNDQYSGALYDHYPNTIKNLVNVIAITKEQPANVNIYQVSRILRVLVMHLMTDHYGDVPYFKAGLGFYEGNFAPEYDAQSKIYPDMLKELEEASKGLSSSAAFPASSDFVYGGDVNKWKKFANSLMLRLAMRMQKVDETNAKAWVTKAITGGTMDNLNDSFAFKHDNDGFRNPNGQILGNFPGARNDLNARWSKTLVDMMNTRKDPRLGVISQVGDGDRTVSKQKGLPNGLDESTFAKLSDPTIINYSKPSTLLLDPNDPNVMMAYSEVEFLKAEAIARGWATGSDTDAYKKGVTAALKQLVVYDAKGAIADTDVTAYLTANPFPSTNLADKMKAIHTEMYLLMASTFNHYEGWANWRRTNIPALTPVNYQGNETSGQIPRRMRYPQSEAGVNPNYKIANDRQGGDTFMVRVWWDK